MLPAEKAPVSDGKGALFRDYGQQARLRTQATSMGPSNRASALVLHMNSTAREVRSAAGVDPVAKNDGAECVVDTPTPYSSLETADSTYQEVGRLLQFVGRAV